MRTSKYICFKNLFMVLAIVLFFADASFANDTIVVGWHNWPPHQMINDDGDLVGVNIELITKIFNRAGLKAKFRKIPWKRNLKELKDGTIDVAMSALKTSEREEYAYFSDTHFKLEHNVLFINKSDKEKHRSIKSLKDILGTDFRLGVALGFVYSDEHKELLKDENFKKHLEIVSDYKNNVKKLIKNRIDGFIEDELTGAASIKELGLDGKVDILFYLFGEEDASAYLMFSKKSMTKEQVEKINMALRNMKADGSYQQILDKYQLR